MFEDKKNRICDSAIPEWKLEKIFVAAGLIQMGKENNCSQLKLNQIQGSYATFLGNIIIVPKNVSNLTDINDILPSWSNKYIQRVADNIIQMINNLQKNEMTSKVGSIIHKVIFF